jgi:hypothetical protein
MRDRQIDAAVALCLIHAAGRLEKKGGAYVLLRSIPDDVIVIMTSHYLNPTWKGCVVS